MSAVDVEAAKEAFIAAARACRLSSRYADRCDRSKEAAMWDALSTLDAALAPPPPERRRWIVETENRPVGWGGVYVRGQGMTMWERAYESSAVVDVVVSVEPVWVNTVTLEPGQRVVRDGDRIVGNVASFADVIVREFVAPTPETGAL